jgi:1-acyl-sn-glycerol-3-phosphate acyltransferase
MTSNPTPVPAPWPAAISIPLRFLYGIYAAALFLVVALTALVGVLLIPTLKLRRGTARIAARTYLLLAGMPLRLRGTENLPAGQCVVVANHASYLDGVVMAAALPPRFGFVIKREMNDVPVAGLLLRRIGSEFVDRFNRHKGGMDARRVLRTAASGHSLVFFPEGTFTPAVGLRLPRGACRDPGYPAQHAGHARSAAAGSPRSPFRSRHRRDTGGRRRSRRHAAQRLTRGHPRRTRRAGPGCLKQVMGTLHVATVLPAYFV